MTAPPIHLYAELLLHINTISLHGSINTTNTTEATEAVLFTDGPILRVVHAGSTATLRLPVQTIGNATSTVQLPAGQPKEIAARLEVKAKDLSHLVTLQQDGQDSLPWEAKHLTQDTRIFCKQCGQDLFEADHAVGDWRDLPSENWAEMMDFWHCHKPVNHRATAGASDAHAHKGYAASNHLKAIEGVGLVDVSTFLMAAADLKDLKKESTENETLLFCASKDCKQLLGHVDSRGDGLRIHKWSVALQPSSFSARQSFPEEKWITAQMLSVLDAQSVRQFVVRKPLDQDPPEEKWLLWLFTPDLRFCSSTSPGAIVSGESSESNSGSDVKQKEAEAGFPVRACKILYRKLPSTSADENESTTAQQEHLDLPAPLAAALFKTLQGSANLLPPKARTQGMWQIGLLRRFAPEDVPTTTTAGGGA